MTDLARFNLVDLLDVARRDGVPMFGAPAVGIPLVSNGNLGGDLIHVEAGESFPIHTHPGDHLLLCLAGAGTISVAGVTYRVKPMDLYMVPGLVPHAVGAPDDAEHFLLAIGSPHKGVADPSRMAWTDWEGNPVDDAIAAVGLPVVERD
jgi:quercetin dioxygenase-like cupin family protein